MSGLNKIPFYVLIFCLFTFSGSQALERLSHPTLYLHRGEMNRDVKQTAVSQHTIPNYLIVQFENPITQLDREKVLAQGVEILEYLPDYAYLVRGGVEELRALSGLDDVYSTYPFTLADKLSPSLLSAVVKNRLEFNAIQLFDWEGGVGVETAVFTPTQLWQLAANPDIRWIEPIYQPQLFNDEARQVGNVNAVWEARRFFGAGQIVGIADSGLDSGNLATLSPDFANRIVAAHPLVDGESWDDNQGHGTHVAGSVLGAGVQSGADIATQAYQDSYAGMAPEAELVVQAFEVTPEGAVIGLDPDYYNLFEQAYDDGARIHSNSWGGATGDSGEAQYGGYPFGAQRTDAFIWEHPDMAIFVAAGNAGTDGTIDQICFDGDGRVDEDSLASPGTAKNVITVGATENNRPTGGLGGTPWIVLGCFFFPPVATDTLANNPNGMAAFSSRGPTDDGRFKPDIVAPGTNILSNRSHGDGATTLWAAHETNEHYSYSGGTSMATPIAAGMGTLIREWLTTEMGLEAPSAALLKAILLNGAQNIAPGQYGTESVPEIPTSWPNSVAGWGRADLSFLTPEDSFELWFVENNEGLETGEAVLYSEIVTVTSAEQPLRINLVWTDPPASLSAAKQLVNDLDLIVAAPNGSVLFGNGIDNGDRINNVEGLVIDAPQVGSYTIQVRAHQVPMGPQPYALVASGALNVSGEVPPPPVNTAYYIYLPTIFRE